MKKKYYKLDGSVEEVDVDNTQPSSQRITYDSNNQRQVSRIEPQQTALVKGSNLFDDGYQFGDVARTIGSTIGDIGTNVAKGFLGHVEGVTDWAQERAADILDKTGGVYIPGVGKVGIQGAPDWLRQNARFNSTGALFGTNENPMQNIPTYDVGAKLHEGSVAGDVTNQLASGIGQIGAAAGMSYLGGGLVGQGTKAAVGLNAGATYASAKGNAFNRYLESGMSEEEANARSNIDGIAEAVSEQVFAGLPIKNTAGWGDVLSDKIADKVGQKIGSATAGKLFRVLLDGVGEGSEEVISGLIKTVGDDLVVDKKNGQATLNDVFDLLSNPDTWSEATMAGVTSVLLGTANMGLDTHTRNQILQEYAKSKGIPLTQAKQIFNQTANIYGEISGNPNSYLQREESEQEILNQPEAMDRLADRVRNQSQPIQQVQQQSEQIQPIQQAPLQRETPSNPSEVQNTPNMEQTNVQEANIPANENEQIQDTSKSLNEEIKEPVISEKQKYSKENKAKASKTIVDNIKDVVDLKKGEAYNRTPQTVVDTYKDLPNRLKLEDFNREDLVHEIATDEAALDYAQGEVNKTGDLEANFKRAIDLLKSDKRITKNDKAYVELVLDNAMKSGNNEIAQELTSELAIRDIEAGQWIQSSKIFRNMSPFGKLDTFVKMIQREQEKGERHFKQVNLTQEMVDKVMECYDQDGNFDEDIFDKNFTNLQKEVVSQMKSTLQEKVRFVRMTSMLLNPQTHIRNIMGNTGNVAMRGLKNNYARAMETMFIRNQDNRTKTFKPATKEIWNLAKEEAQNEKSSYSESKYSEGTMRNQLLKDIKPFKQDRKGVIGKLTNPIAKTLNKAGQLNSWALEAEDNFFSTYTYKRSLAEFLTARGIKSKADLEGKQALLAQAKDYALQEARESTFHQQSNLAEAIEKWEQKELAKDGPTLGKAAVLMVEGEIPFRKTPINIVRTAVEYSPLNMAKVGSDIVKVSKGEMDASTMINDIAKTSTGMSLAGLGILLASLGMVKGNEPEKQKKEQYEEGLGEQDYSLMIGDKRYDLTWLSPAAIPFFTGATAYNELVNNQGIDGDTLLAIASETIDPISSMTLLSSLSNTMQSYGSKNTGEFLADFGINAVENYLTQGIPTILSKIAATKDDRERTTAVGGDSTNKELDKLINKIKLKLPWARETLEEKTDSWGRTKTTGNVGERFVQNFLNPGKVTTVKKDKTDEEITRVYDALVNSNSSVASGALPKQSFDKSINLNDNLNSTRGDKKLSASELTELKKTYGKIAKEKVDALIKTPEYKKATDLEKAKYLASIYDYANEKSKQEYAKKHGTDYVMTQLQEMVDVFNIPLEKAVTSKNIANITSKEAKQNGYASATAMKKAEVDKISGLSALEKDALKRKYTMFMGNANYKENSYAMVDAINRSNLSKTEKDYIKKFLDLGGE